MINQKREKSSYPGQTIPTGGWPQGNINPEAQIFDTFQSWNPHPTAPKSAAHKSQGYSRRGALIYTDPQIHKRFETVFPSPKSYLEANSSLHSVFTLPEKCSKQTFRKFSYYLVHTVSQNKTITLNNPKEIPTQCY
jgi:hypothetical protein